MTTIGAMEPTLEVHQAGSALEGMPTETAVVGRSRRRAMPTARACVACQRREER
jgi:RNA polymerase-binding transcription factor DksA